MWPQFLAEVRSFLAEKGVERAACRNTLPLGDLTPRELDVLECIARGLDNAEIAASLGLSEKTVRNHITRVFDKIGVEHQSAMPKFVIEREIVGAGKLPRQERQAISQKSCGVLQSMGPKIQWVQSFVTNDKIYCVYIAPDEETVKQHAQKGGFPANLVARVRSVIDPTAE